jgi:membrane protein YqaA with SNARE-associated domain
MRRLLDWVQGFASALGGPGLFVLAFLDSSFLSFPEVCDALIVLLTIRHPERMLYYATLCTAGSVLGCYALYYVSRRGGEAFLRKRVSGASLDRAMARFDRYGMLAIIVPSLLPPPMPFKAFVFAAGVARMRTLDFIAAVTIGRAIRFYGEGFLALWYGERALAFLRENMRLSILIALGLAAALAAAWVFWKRVRREAS